MYISIAMSLQLTSIHLACTESFMFSFQKYHQPNDEDWLSQVFPMNSDDGKDKRNLKYSNFIASYNQ